MDTGASAIFATTKFIKTHLELTVTDITERTVKAAGQIPTTRICRFPLRTAEQKVLISAYKIDLGDRPFELILVLPILKHLKARIMWCDDSYELTFKTGVRKKLFPCDPHRNSDSKTDQWPASASEAWTLQEAASDKAK